MTDENAADQTAHDDISSTEQVDQTATHETEEQTDLTPEQQAEAEEKAEAEKKQASERTKLRRKQRQNAKIRRAEERAQQAEIDAAYWKGKAEAGAGKQETKGDERPQQDDFETYEEFTDALVDWKLAQAGKDDKTPPDEGKESTRQTKSDDVQGESEEFKAFKAAGQEKYPDDFEDMMETIASDDFPMSMTMAEAVVNEEYGVELAMHLYDNPDEADRIAKLSPLSQLRELDKIGQTLGKSEEKPTKKISNAPDPANLEKGSSVQDAGLENLSTEEYIAKRQKQKAAAG